jgi:uncharacterized membrane protein YhaH (DUF805 family)
VKPHFLLVWALVDLVLLANRGPRALLRAEQVAVIAIGAAYLLSVPLLTPGYLVVARLAVDAYGDYATTNPWALLTLSQARLAGVALACAVLALGVRRWHGAARPDPVGWLLVALAAAVVGFTAAVLLQRRGWTYHWIPVKICALLLVAVAVVAAAPAFGRWPIAQLLVHARRVAAAVGTVGLFWLTARGVEAADVEWELLTGRSYQLPAMASLVNRAGPNASIAALSTNMGVGFPLVSYTRARWVLRFNALWPLVGAYEPRAPDAGAFPYHAPAEMQRAERFMFDAMVADLTAHRPTLLIVDTTPPGYVLHGFDYLRYFGQDARFAALLAEYRELPRIQRYRVFYRAAG